MRPTFLIKREIKENCVKDAYTSMLLISKKVKKHTASIIVVLKEMSCHEAFIKPHQFSKTQKCGEY